MDDEYIQIEMTRKEWEQWTSNIATNAVKAAFGYGTLAPLVTVEDRCRERWSGVSAKIRRRIRDVFVAMVLREAWGKRAVLRIMYCGGDRASLSIARRGV
jgi:hypothetical protein